MKKLLFASSLMAFTIVFLPMTANSSSIPDRGPISFSAYDTNGDGLISEKEFIETRSERVSKQASQGMPMRGALSAPSFSAFDINQDGTLTNEELSKGQKTQMEKRRSMGMGLGSGMNKGIGMERNMPSFSEFDLNGDGKILERELNEARSKRISERAQQGYQMRNLSNASSFTDIDANADGHISGEEFTAHQAQSRQKRTQ